MKKLPADAMTIGNVLPLKQADPLAPRYVRITARTARGFVEFQFSIGDPRLYLEMTLPTLAFDEFCRAQNAQLLSVEAAAAVDRDERRWRFGDQEEES